MLEDTCLGALSVFTFKYKANIGYISLYISVFSVEQIKGKILFIPVGLWTLMLVSHAAFKMII